MQKEGLTQKQLADKAGITPKSLNARFLEGYFSKNYLKKIGDVFGVDLSPFATSLSDEDRQAMKKRVYKSLEQTKKECKNEIKKYEEHNRSEI